jgi:hypothetical protein
LLAVGEIGSEPVLSHATLDGYTPNNQVPQQKLYEKLKLMLSHLGMHPEH